MHITGLRIRNYGRFRGEHELTLTRGVWAIEARDVSNPERSNYLGKSLLMSAIRWCLDGDNPRDDARVLDDLISRGCDDMGIDIEFSNGLFVSREKKRGKSADLLVDHNGQEMRGEKAQPTLDQLVGLSAADRLATCWAEQRELSSLVRMKSTPLTATVEEWLGMERLVEAGEKVSERFKAVLEEWLSAKSKISELEGLADFDTIDELEQKIIKETERIETLAKKSRDLSEQFLTYNERKRLTELLRELEEVEDSYSEPKKLDPEVKATLDVRRTELAHSRIQLRILGELAIGKFNGRCPVSQGFTCPARDQINENVEKHLREHSEEEKRCNELQWSVNSLARDVSENENAHYLAKAVRAEIAKLKLQIEALNKRGIKPLEKNEQPPEPAELPDRTDLNVWSRELEKRKQARVELEKLRKRFGELERSYQAHRAAAIVLGPEGARRKAVERTVQTIWHDATQRLQRAGASITLEALWGRETSKLADECQACGTAFPKSTKVKACVPCGAPRGPKVRHEFHTRLSDYSGAAEDLAGFGLRCAAFQWLREARGASWAIGMFDEPTAQCDAYHRRAIGAHILRLLGTTFDQVFLVSHDRGVFTAIPQRILITGEDRWSRVEVVTA